MTTNTQEGWQPIETAPKDGTVILGVQFLNYLGGGAFPIGATMMWEGGPGRVMKGCWAYTGHIVQIVTDEDQPTHWMPLPPPPSSQGGGE